jgi:hypothetical protein
MTKAINYIKNAEWAVFVIVVERVALAVLESADALPEGAAKTSLLAGAGAVTALVVRLRVWSMNSVSKLGG